MPVGRRPSHAPCAHGNTLRTAMHAAVPRHGDDTTSTFDLAHFRNATDRHRFAPRRTCTPQPKVAAERRARRCRHIRAAHARCSCLVLLRRIVIVQGLLTSAGCVCACGFPWAGRCGGCSGHSRMCWPEICPVAYTLAACAPCRRNRRARRGNPDTGAFGERSRTDQRLLPEPRTRSDDLRRRPERRDRVDTTRHDTSHGLGAWEGNRAWILT